jgi:hypothetical protein
MNMDFSFDETYPSLPYSGERQGEGLEFQWIVVGLPPDQSSRGQWLEQKEIRIFRSNHQPLTTGHLLPGPSPRLSPEYRGEECGPLAARRAS